LQSELPLSHGREFLAVTNADDEEAQENDITQTIQSFKTILLPFICGSAQKKNLVSWG